MSFTPNSDAAVAAVSTSATAADAAATKASSATPAAAPARPSRRERERLARRREILDAARTVFAERGFVGATLEEIASRAEFGKGTLYN
ncbi:MAG: helix-turn-helix transcriptional regulator, partial [Rhodothermales bacterium]|nr:helix-turn-helix transcriptional regulator [Rhodothermales bacterium]